MALAYTYVVGEFFHFALALYFFRGYPIDSPSLEYFRYYTKFAVPLSIAVVSSIIMTNIDKVFIQLFWNAIQVGEYFAVFNLSRFITLFSSAVSMLLLPTVSEHYTRNDMIGIKRLTIDSERYLSIIVFPMVIMLMVLAQPVIRILLSDKYMPALSVLQILPVFVLLDVLSGPYTQKFSGMDMPHITRNRVLIMMSINVILNLILIPRDIKSLGLKLFGLGTTGAAIATIAAYAAGLVYIRIAAWKITRVKGSWRIIIHAFAAILMGFDFTLYE